jgi:flagellar biosynthesis/type III secretory pathway protein FliH
MELPSWSGARVESAEFNQVVPTEYRADLVILLLDGKPILAIVREVQLSPDKDKRESWPVYLTRWLDGERSSLYVDLTMASLSAAARRSLEELMKSGDYEYQTEFVRQWIDQGLEKGLKTGREEGRLEGEQTALVKVLEARGFTLDDAVRQRIHECTQLAQIELWLRKAVAVTSVHELFEAPSP